MAAVRGGHGGGRGIAYFGSTAITANLLVIAAYGVVGIVVVYLVLLDVGHQLIDLPNVPGGSVAGTGPDAVRTPRWSTGTGATQPG